MNASLPKLMITDIDGVWTDGGMYYSDSGIELKKFNTSDSAGVLFLNLHNIPTAIVTGEDTDIVRKRAKKLKIQHVYCGVRDKVSVAQQLCEQHGIELNDVAFIGDDLNDFRLLELVGCSACPANAPPYIQEKVRYVMSKRGGNGAFREFVELLLAEANLLDQTISRFLDKLDKPT